MIRTLKDVESLDIGILEGNLKLKKEIKSLEKELRSIEGLGKPMEGGKADIGSLEWECVSCRAVNKMSEEKCFHCGFHD